MASTGLQRRIVHGYQTTDNDTISRGDKSFHLGPDTENHHRLMLASISSLIEVENLTDMTIQCSEGLYVYTHKKLLSSVSSLARKLSREHYVSGENQRLHLIINVSTVSSIYYCQGNERFQTFYFKLARSNYSFLILLGRITSYSYAFSQNTLYRIRWGS